MFGPTECYRCHQRLNAEVLLGNSTRMALDFALHLHELEKERTQLIQALRNVRDEEVSGSIVKSRTVRDQLLVAALRNVAIEALEVAEDSSRKVAESPVKRIIRAAWDVVFDKSADSSDTDEYPVLEKALRDLGLGPHCKEIWKEQDSKSALPDPSLR